MRQAFRTATSAKTIARGRHFLSSAGRASLAFVSALLLVAGCAQPRALVAPLGQTSFAGYQRESTQWLSTHRDFQTPERASEIAWNSPFELRPAGSPRKGILLVLGLGDSPGSFTDIAKALADQGFLVRTVLLPGHGTKPADLLEVDVEDWRRLVREQIAILGSEVAQVYLGGFSTGANLALEYAIDQPTIDGVLLFSPAFKAENSQAWILPWLAPFRPWLREPESGRPQQTPVRYLNVPTNGFAQFYRSSTSVRDKIARQPYDKPTLIVLTEHDSVVDVRFVLDTFLQRFTHPASRLIWYGEIAGMDDIPPRVLVRSDRLADERISQFSHMAVLFAPQNPLYGRQGTQRLCWNGQAAEALQQCLAGAELWYSDWGYREAGKVHARLTFNPYFDWQAMIMNDVISATK